METLLTLEMVTLVNGLAIQHSSEWEDYLEMNAQIHGLTKEEYAAYYLGTQWQMQCMESLQMLAEKKVTRKQLDKAINDVAKITNDLKKVVKDWAAARDAGKTEEQAKKLEELKKLNDEKTAAQKVVDGHIQQLDKNVELETSESMNEKYRETRHQSTDFSEPGNDGDIYFSKREGSAVGVKRGDKLQMIYVFQKEPKLGKIQKSDKRWENMGPASEKLLIDLIGREEGKILFKFVSTLEESVNEAVSRSTKIYCVATPAPQKMLVQELENIFGDDYRNIVTEFTDDEGYESVLLFNLTKNDIASIQKRVADVLIWEYSIKRGKEIMESVNEKIQVASLEDAIEAEQGGDLNKRHLDKILKLKAAKRMHTMTRAEEKTYQAILRKYKIAMDDAHVGDMMEAIDMDMVNTEYGFWGTMDQKEDFDSVEIAYEDAMNYLMGSFKFTDEGAYNFLNSKWGRKLVDEYYDGGHYNMVDTIDAFTSPTNMKKYARQFNESKTTMKNLETLESFINEAAPKMSDSAETKNLLNLRDQVANAQKGGSEGRYGKDFEKAKTKALRAIEQMITYAKIGV
tara:strand:- start:2462 stop:4171 length:1710 start_codon:yes stop_codon:yes gene_type:complete